MADDEHGWPELVPFLFECVQSGIPNLMESALNIFATLATYLSNSMKQHLSFLVQILNGCLAHQNRDVQLAALKAVSNFVQVR